MWCSAFELRANAATPTVSLTLLLSSETQCLRPLQQCQKREPVA
jgi:hypothetical protein